MIKRIRRNFIRITMAAVTVVMLVLCLCVNGIYAYTINSQLNDTLLLISRNEGKIPKYRINGGNVNNPNNQDSSSTSGFRRNEFKREDFEKTTETKKPESTDSMKMPEKQEKPGDFGINNNSGENANEEPRGLYKSETPFSTRFFTVVYNSEGTVINTVFDNIATVSEDNVDTYVEKVLNKEGYGFYSNFKYYIKETSEGNNMAIFLDCSKELSSLRTTIFISLFAMAVCILWVYIIVLLFSNKAIEPYIKSHEKQKQFITDASHELKTPITVIATSLKVLEMDVGKQKWIDKAIAQTEKLKELVNSLVTLSRMDEENSFFKFNVFNISDTMSETVESYRDFAESNGHEVICNIENGVTFKGDEYAIRQLVSILIDNAVKYASKDTPIRLTLTASKRHVVVTSSNQADEINKDELEKVFERFYRTDKSRNSNTGGFGIGLSIARSIAEEHNGTIVAKSEDGVNVDFVVRMRKNL